MTAVAPPPNFQPIPRAGWSSANGGSNGLNAMSADEVSRMLMPRKSAQRSNSTSSITSSASSSSTVSATAVQPNGVLPNGDWSVRRKPGKGLWAPSKAEPVSELSNPRMQPVASTAGPSATSSISALQPPSMVPSSLPPSPLLQPHTATGKPRVPERAEHTPILYLTPMNGTFERKTITLPFFPDVVRIGRQTNQKTIPTATNGYFDSKVLSRSHAEIWADRNGKVFIRDIKSSNGTFVNGSRLSPENKESDPHELREQDVLELGIDIVSDDQKTVVHHKVAARVEHAGFYSTANSVLDLNFGDLDPSTSGSLISPSLGQTIGQMRGRSGSQGSIGNRPGSAASMAGSNMSYGQQRQHFWLAPITMDQIVKKINAEFKQAKQQSTDLQRTGQYLESVLVEPKKEGNRSSPTGQNKYISVKGDIKTRFSDPPAPPPQQPLPEKPDVARSSADSLPPPPLRRTDTEKSPPKSPPKPHMNGGPLRADMSDKGEVSKLVEALNTAKRELDNQNIRLKDLEELLAHERQARESAEERAQRLEIEKTTHVPSPSAEPDIATPEVDGDIDATSKEQTLTESTTSAAQEPDSSLHSRLQQRLEAMMSELTETKNQAELFRKRAETAEKESANDRQSLQEMVERIRREDAEREARKNDPKDEQRKPKLVKRLSGGSGWLKSPLELEGAQHEGNTAETANGTLIHSRPSSSSSSKSLEIEAAEVAAEVVKKIGLQNGSALTAGHVEQQLEQAVGQVLGGRPWLMKGSNWDNAESATPYASMLGVVLIGVGLMAWMNNWQKDR
ncbi:hypothetical protein P152DRAFT_476045 [Eremomyces bilateralis CBS 781.70]|uniref:FHA domain-containing protein n=1 Tax=Eremomyces bilateralis CBS 781.70 TaxID=1392243 RepID=A0A6G1FW40_9PEZI|nr:uncharacterized protein P152DRAFT_476045 [Eremomyces bilateralis CBS 781.70]KAF1809912.1 hypothetical protein P152DRAFT_476045 [Eremomyces bilateralis CBS 781.70]